MPENNEKDAPKLILNSILMEVIYRGLFENN